MPPAFQTRPQRLAFLVFTAKLLLVLLGVSGFQHGAPPDRALLIGQIMEGIQLVEQKQYEKAFPMLRSNIELLEKTGPDSLWLNACVKLDLCFYHLEYVEEGILFFEKALQKRPLSLKMKAQLLLLLGDNYYLKGDHLTALQTYEKGLPEAEQLNDFKLLKLYYGNMGWLYWEKGDHAKALTMRQQALQWAMLQGDTANIPRLLSDVGDTYRTMQDRQSLHYFRRALALQPENAQTRIQFSKAYQAFQEPDSALWMLRSAWAFLQDETDKADFYYQDARLLLALRRIPEAIVQIEKSLHSGRAGYGIDDDQYNRLAMMAGNIYSAAGSIERALFWFNDVLHRNTFLPARQGTSAPIRLQDLAPDSYWVMGSLEGKGRMLMLQYRQTGDTLHLLAALDIFETGLSYAEKMRLSYSQESSKIELYEYVQPIVEGGIQAALAMARIRGDDTYLEKAFLWAERAKAPVMAEALYDRNVKHIAGIPDSVLAQEQYLQDVVVEAELAAWGAPDSAHLQTAMLQARLQLESLKDDIKRRFPRYFSLKYAFSKPVRLQQITEHIDDQTLLVQYFAGDSTLYAFALYQNKVRSFMIPWNVHFHTRLNRFRRSVSDWDFVRDSAAQAERDFLETATLLYDQILQPAFAETNPSRLVIIPDGLLGLIPFEVLLSQPYAGSWKDLETPFLIKQFAVSYAWSSSAISIGSPAQSAAKYHFAGFGTAYESNAGKEVAMRVLGPLPHADDEVRAIAEILPGKVWLNRQATRENFLAAASDCDILHLAVHGVLNESQPMLSHLVFQEPDSGGAHSVYASELYNLPLQARMTVLSACNTGKGAVRNGEGMMSLARAFAFAGCPTLVGSLWSVNDLSTSRIMRTFYGLLEKGVPVDEAMRQAKLHYLEHTDSEWSKPIYWAGFMVVGDAGVLPLSGHGMYQCWKWGLAAFVLLIVLWKYTRYQKKKQKR